MLLSKEKGRKRRLRKQKVRWDPGPKKRHVDLMRERRETMLGKAVRYEMKGCNDV